MNIEYLGKDNKWHKLDISGLQSDLEEIPPGKMTDGKLRTFCKELGMTLKEKERKFRMIRLEE